jgi:erythromycin esterase
MARTAFLDWAKRAMIPLRTGEPEPLVEMIGDAEIVALSEGVHGAKEPLEFRNRLFECLVREKAFTAIALESGIVEGRVVHEYVRGGPGDIDSVTKQGLSFGFERLPQNRALIEWIRAYNASCSKARNVNFYGFDVAGSLGNSGASRGADTALAEALDFIERVDASSYTLYRERIDPLIQDIQFELIGTEHSRGYHRLTKAHRDALTSALADLIALFEFNQSQYTAATSPQEYEWGYRGAVAARQVDNCLRQIPMGWHPTAQLSFEEKRRLVHRIGEVREWCQADNVNWIMRCEGLGAKILVFAHAYHLSAVPVTTGGLQHHVAGTYLHRNFGKRLVSIGNLIGGGSYGGPDFAGTIQPASPETIEGASSALGESAFALDLRTAPDTVTAELDGGYLLGRGNFEMQITRGSAYDLLLFFNTVTPVSDFG